MDENKFPFKGNFSKLDLNKNIRKKITKYLSIGTFSLTGCLGFMLIVVVIALFLSPLFRINTMLERIDSNSFTEKLGNFLTFRGWCTDIECSEKEENDFYTEIQDIYDDYLKDKGVEINVNLITATLTYTDPFTTIENDDTTSMIDFKKSSKKITDLAENMVSEQTIEICYSKETKVEVNCDTEQEITKEEKNIYYYDDNKYREYLQEEFIKKFYFNNKITSDDQKITKVIEEIYRRVEYFEILTDSKSSANFAFNNSAVRVLDCNGLLIEEVSLYEYLQGVLYLEGYATNRSQEFLKVMAIATKNYIYSINGASMDNIPTTLSVKSCQLNQIYCSVSSGCHMLDDGIDEIDSTVASGSNSEGEYYLPPLEDIETLTKIKEAIDSTFNEFIVKDGKFVTTQYRSSCSGTCDSSNNILDQSKANQMINNGNDYKEVLNYFYDGEITTLELFAVGYPLDLKNNNVTSAYGWRVHPINNCCTHHNGTDIAAPGGDKIYSIDDGVVVTVGSGDTGYGNYVVIMHDGYYSLYAHQQKTIVNVGDEVKIGQQIGLVGSTGNSTGNHLHIEIYTMEDGKKIRQDPVEHFKNIELIGQVGLKLYESIEECMNTSGKGACN